MSGVTSSNEDFSKQQKDFLTELVTRSGNQTDRIVANSSAMIIDELKGIKTAIGELTQSIASLRDQK